MTGHRSAHPTDRFLRGLKTLLESLPTREERDKVAHDLRDMENFLVELRSLVEAIPTMESTEAVSSGLSRLDILTERASRNSALRAILGLGYGSPGKARPSKDVDVDSKVLRLQEQLEKSSTPDVGEFLERLNESNAVYAALAKRLGVRTKSKERKGDLIRDIAAYIENQRGYRILRGEAEGAESDSRPRQNGDALVNAMSEYAERSVDVSIARSKLTTADQADRSHVHVAEIEQLKRADEKLHSAEISLMNQRQAAGAKYHGPIDALRERIHDFSVSLKAVPRRDDEIRSAIRQMVSDWADTLDREMVLPAQHRAEAPQQRT